MAEDIIRKRMTNDGWIPVEERMPERDGFYLISVDVPAKIDEIKVHKVWFGEKTKTFWGYGNVVTAWMPLPEPYRPERSGD